MSASISTKIKLACTVAGISVSELARRLGMFPQNLSQRLQVDKFSSAELEKIAAAIGCEFDATFIFPDGTKV